MECSSCQHANPDEARFCNACGIPLVAACFDCGRENPPGSRFCNGCGAGLAEADTSPRESAEPAEGGASRSARAASPQSAAALAEPRLAHRAADPRSYTPRHLAERILTQKAALEGERKHVTVVFADIADSTALAEQVGDPEVMHGLLDRAFQLILAEVHGFEGTINQFTGDGVMALFGAPLALEDAPRRAIVAGLAIQRALAPLDAEVHEQYGRRFQMRVGIHSGPVVVGSIGDDLRMDYTAVGDTTNLAARLESLAAGGQVIISETTSRLVEGFFDLAPLPPALLKGKSEPVQAYQVMAARPVAGRIDARAESGEGLTAYVGRDRELDALLSAFEQASEGRGQVAFVVGDAGIGKSRLLHEFRRRLSGKRHAWMEGRCASYARATPFYAVADAVRRNMGIDDRDDEARALQKIAESESTLGNDLAWTLPYVRVLLSLPSGSEEVDALDAMSRRAEMCRALHARLVRAAGRTPEVIVIEDLHWVDAASEEFLAFVADTIPALPVLLVVTHRPGHQHAFGDRSYHLRIPMQALSEEAMSSMVSSVLEGAELPLPLRRLVAEKAEGNPLFVEEVTASLLEEGVLALQQGKATLTRGFSDISIPDRLQDVLMARLDRLPEEPKRAIQIASVIGREFAMRLLSRIHDAAGQLDEIVGELRALELIYEKAAYPELAFMFKHALTHEAAYDSVLVAKRKALHRVVGVAIEGLYGDRITEHYEALAHHFDESEDYERALRYHVLASEKAVATYANHSAVEHTRKALALVDRLGNVPVEHERGLYARLGQCCWWTSDFGGSAAGFRRAAEATTEPAGQALLMGRAAMSYLWDHDYDACRDAIERAREPAAQPGAEAGRAARLMAGDVLGLVHGRGLADDADCDEALRLAEASGNVAVLVNALGHSAQRAEWRGDYRRAIADAGRGIDLARINGRPGDGLVCAWFLGISSVCIGDYTQGLSVLGDGLELCDRIGDRAIKARLLNTLGWAHSEFGAHERASEFNRAGTELARELVELGLVAAAPELYANSAINLARSLSALDRFDDAAEQLEPIQRQYEDDPDPWMRWRWSTHLLHQQARLELARGNPERALEIATLEAGGAQAACAQKLIGRSHELMGRIHLVLDQREEAESHLLTARRIAQEIEHPSVSLQASSLLSELARRRGDRQAASREQAAMSRLIELLAPNLPDETRRREFVRMGERLAADPLAPYH